jgi:asparagine synthase (glutamine-hydrolysing)
VSGLAALFRRDGAPADRRAAQEMLAAAPHRGPDGMWTRISGPVVLGHAKMAVTPEEEHEQQPLVSPRTDCAIIADVRLDNRDDLLARLPDRPASTLSDAELILRAYEAWGDDAPVHLLGDFAFVIWDPGRQRLVCARDPAGQRALFYRSDRATFAAASEIQQLLQDPTVRLVPNEERILDHLVPLNIHRIERDQAATFYQGIYSVPAGHVLVVDREAVRARRYWQLEPPAELRYRRDDEYAEHYLALFSEVVRARLRSSRPVGVLLSGGLDSSSIVAVAQELYRSGRAVDRGFSSLSFVFDGLECDEHGLIGDLQAKYGFEARYIAYPTIGGWLHPTSDGFLESPNMGLFELRHAIFGAATRAGR